MTRPTSGHFSAVQVMMPTPIVDRLTYAAERDGYGFDNAARQRFLFDVLVAAVERSEARTPIVRAEERLSA